MNIFVGNVNSMTTEQQLEHLFTPYGEVSSVKIINDPYTRRPKGFAFVEMPERSNAENAVAKLNHTSLHGQPLTVNEARPRTSSNDSFNRRR